MGGNDQWRMGRDVRDVRLRPCCRTKNGVGLKLSKTSSSRNNDDDGMDEDGMDKDRMDDDRMDDVGMDEDGMD